MRIQLSLLSVSALAAFALIGSPAVLPGSQAQAACHAQTFHDERAEGGACCFSDHFHSGSGTGGSRAQATVSAVRAWEDFVYFEYGASYDRWTMAHSKSLSCANGAGWSCTVEARACHRAG